MRGWLRPAVTAAIAIAFAACDAPPGLDAEQICDAYCGCVAPLPHERATCTTQCEAQLGPGAVPDACLACLDEPLCSGRTSCILDCFLPTPGGTP